MTEVLPAKCYDTGKLVRFGYIELEGGNKDFLPKGERIRGHEFHYYDSEDNGADCLAIKPVTGKSYPCIITTGNCLNVITVNNVKFSVRSFRFNRELN